MSGVFESFTKIVHPSAIPIVAFLNPAQFIYYFIGGFS